MDAYLHEHTCTYVCIFAHTYAYACISAFVHILLYMCLKLKTCERFCLLVLPITILLLCVTSYAYRGSTMSMSLLPPPFSNRM